MPYIIRKQGDKFCVFKKGSDGNPTGSSKGCHDTEPEAESQRKALYAAETKGIDMPDEIKDYYDGETWRPYGGAVSFSEMEAMEDARNKQSELDSLNWSLQALIRNVIVDDEIEDKSTAINSLIDEYTQRVENVKRKEGFFKSIVDFFRPKEEDPYALVEEKVRSGPAMKRENGIDFPARDYAYVPDTQKPSTWRIRLTESPGKVTKSQLGKAAAAMSSGGFRGQKVQIPAAAISSVKRRIRQEYRKLGVADNDIPASVRIDAHEPRSTKEGSSFLVFKDAAGDYRWFSIYSNNYRDDDRRPEIIAGASHRAFVKAVDEGIFPMPELWLWHYPYPVGDADWLDYTDKGLALACGRFRDGFEDAAKNLAEYPDPLGTSHGMPKQYLVRDDKDPSIIWFHATKEISPLPVWAAANRLTAFVVLEKENSDMPISEQKKGFLRNILGDEAFSQLDDSIKQVELAASESGRESKEADATPEPVTTEEATTASGESEPEVEPAYATRQEVAEAVTAVMEPLIKSLQDISTRLAGMESSMKEIQVKSDDTAATTRSVTPRASLSELITAQLSERAVVKEGSSLDSAGPRETKPPSGEETGIAFIDNLIANSQRRGG